jgi:hypothetical protein
MAMTQPAEATDLQFDRAEFSGQPANPTCAACQQPVVDRYFDVNGQMTCATCRETIANTLEKDPGWSAPFIALAAGVGGGLAGAILYYAVVKITGYEIGLIAIVVGLIVGRAVRWGSRGRGGRVYQVMAVAITYMAIVSTYVPFIIEGLRNDPAAQQSTAVEGTPASGAPTGSTGNTGSAGNVEKASDTTSSSRTAAASEGQSSELTLGGVAIALAVLFLLAMAAPILAGFGNIIGWLIIGFALWEAWKTNRRIPLAIAGPFALAPAAAAGVAAAAVPPIPATPPSLPPADLPPAPAAS